MEIGNTLQKKDKKDAMTINQNEGPQNKLGKYFSLLVAPEVPPSKVPDFFLQLQRY